MLGLIEPRKTLMKFGDRVGTITRRRVKIRFGGLELTPVVQMKDMSHDHLVTFIGACIEPPHVCILTDFCSKGSLWEILNCDAIPLDLTFQVSLIGDLVAGMHHLHNSVIMSHGHLKDKLKEPRNPWKEN